MATFRGRFLPFLISLASAVGGMQPTRCSGQPASGWQPDGLPVVVRDGQQLLVSLHPDGSGGAYVFWRDDLPPDPRTTIYFTHLTGAGTPAPGWAAQARPILVPSAALSVAYDGSGGFYLTWNDAPRGDHIIAQRMDADGTLLWPAGGVEVCPGGGHQSGRIIVDDSGALVVVWLDDRFSPPPPFPIALSIAKLHPVHDIFAQKIDPSGERKWAEAGVPVCTDSSDQSVLRAIGDEQGGTIIVWTDSRGWLDADHLRMACIQRLNAAGEPLLAQDGVGIGDIRGGMAIPDGAAGAIVASYDGRNGPGDDVYAQRVDAAGGRLWGIGGVAISTAIYDQRVSAVIPDGSGGAVVAWHDLRNGQDCDVYVQRVTSTGAVATGWPAGGLQVCGQPGNQIYPTITSDGTGGCVVTWYDARAPSGEYDVYAQRVLGTGAIAPGWTADGVALCRAASNQVYPVPVPDESGGAIVAWGDYRGFADVYAQRVSGLGIVGETRTGFKTPKRWPAVRDPGGVARCGTSVETSSEVTAVDLPGAPGLALEGLWPNPTADVFNVSLSLISSERATLELVDVGGRMIVHREIGSLGTGRHLVSLGSAVNLRAGIYLVRLTQAGRSIVSRVCVIR